MSNNLKLTIMKTKNSMVKSMLMSILTAGIMIVGFTACSDDLELTDSNSTNNNENTEAVIPAEQSNDEMNVRVTNNVDGAVLSNFNDNSVGAALARRLSSTSSKVDRDTRLILVNGNDIADYTGSDMQAWAAVYLNGGSIAVERPTGGQLNALADALSEQMATARTAKLTADGDIVVKSRGNRRSQGTFEGDLMKARVQNVKNFATTRSSVADTENGVVAELVIFNTDGCYQYVTKNSEEHYDGCIDQDGVVTEEPAIPANSKVSAYRSGLIADGAAMWLMDEKVASTRTTRGAAESSINEMMSCSDEFTVESYIRTHDWRNLEVSRDGCFRTTYRVWGVNDHGNNANTDYYYVKQNSLIRVGGKVYDCDTGNGYYDTFYWGAYEPRWYRTGSNWENGHDLYYGSWLNKYESMMELTGNGTIAVVQALPTTDNNTNSQTIAIGTSKSESNNIGFTFTAAKDPSVGFNYSHGWTRGTSFTMSNTSVSKDLKVVKNTTGNKVKWTYECGMEIKLYTDNNDKICHPIVPDIVVNDADFENQICWSVKNPSGRYTMKVENYRQMQCLTKKKGEGKKWTDRWYSANRNDSFTFLEPNRAEQTWHFDVTPSTLGKEGHNGDKQKLTEALMNQFPEVFQTLTRVADRTIDSENAIQYTVAYAKNIINDKNGGRTMREYALDLGCDSYVIRWYCMDGNHNDYELTISVK